MSNGKRKVRIANKDYFSEGEQIALKLENRGPIRFDSEGQLSKDILEAYGEYGWYVFQGVITRSELRELRDDVDQLLARAPTVPEGTIDADGWPCLGVRTNRNTFDLARPLSDPEGGKGRYEVKMEEHELNADAPDFVVFRINDPLSLADSFLRLYAHPQLLFITELINGFDFTPFSEAILVKQPGFGASVAWHQDGTTWWDSSELDDSSHGFNFMAQLYGSSAENGVWIVPGSHRKGKIDIKSMLIANGGDPQLSEALPLIASAGDVVICNRQTLHASFANMSSHLRVTINFGFHRRRSVLGVKSTGVEGSLTTYNSDFIERSARIIPLAINARQQKFPNEVPYRYRPLEDELDELCLTDKTRETILNGHHSYRLEL